MESVITIDDDRTYTVGQVVYALMKANGKTLLSPAQVVEEVVRKTIDGEKVSYLVSFPNVKDPMLMSSVQGEFFTSSEHAYNELVFRTTNQMKRMVDAAIAQAEKVYPSAMQMPVRVPMKAVTGPLIGKKLPLLQRPTLETFDPNPLPEDLEEAAQQVHEPAGVTQAEDEGDHMVIDLPDGGKARVRIVGQVQP